jgi:hypothetical protein
MNPSARDYEGRTRNPLWERELARQLRELSEPERFEFLNEFLPLNQVVALELARNCPLEKQSLEKLLDRGLVEADASAIREWLECVVPKLGFRRVLHHLRSRRAVNPCGVERARYWLPLFLEGSGCSESDVAALLPAA